MGLLGGLALACFVGADTMGLPCEQDADCGPKLTCDPSGCCGGACSDGTSPPTSSTTDPGSSSTASTSTSTSTTDAGTGSSEETSSIECGNAMVEKGEECDRGADNGEGVWPRCLADCVEPPFYWTEDIGGDSDSWCPGTACAPEWTVESDHWASGAYFGCETPCAVVPPFRLVSKDFTIPEPQGGMNPTLSIAHSYEFNVCNRDYYDGARVLLDFDGTEVSVLPAGQPSPNKGHLRCDDAVSCPTFCECSPTAEPTSDLFFVGDSGDRIVSEVELDADLAGTARLIFEVGYDWFNCVASTSPDNAWKISAVHVGFKGSPG